MTTQQGLPHPEFVAFHGGLDRLCEQVQQIVDARTNQEDVLIALNLTAYAVRRLEEKLASTVGWARLTGATWATIGDEIGTSKQTAHNRYGATDPLRGENAPE